MAECSAKGDGPFALNHPPMLFPDGPSAVKGVAGMGVGWSEDSSPGVRSESAFGTVGERPRRSSLEGSRGLLALVERDGLRLAVARRAIISLRSSDETRSRRDLRVPMSILTSVAPRVLGALPEDECVLWLGVGVFGRSTAGVLGLVAAGVASLRQEGCMLSSSLPGSWGASSGCGGPSATLRASLETSFCLPFEPRGFLDDDSSAFLSEGFLLLVPGFGPV